MDIDANEVLRKAVVDGLSKAVEAQFGDRYRSPVDSLIKESVDSHSEQLKGLLDSAIEGCMSDSDFREAIVSQARSKLAKILVQRFGGELEKQVNALKSDPTTRARITIAIEEIVKQGT